MEAAILELIVLGPVTLRPLSGQEWRMKDSTVLSASCMFSMLALQASTRPLA
jgi:hypothetical protein